MTSRVPKYIENTILDDDLDAEKLDLKRQEKIQNMEHTLENKLSSDAKVDSQTLKDSKHIDKESKINSLNNEN